MTDHLTAYRDAYEQTGDSLGHVESLSRALYDLAMNHETLGSSDPASMSIVSLIVVIREKAQQATGQHEAEWDAIMAKAAVERTALSAAAERGKI